MMLRERNNMKQYRKEGMEEEDTHLLLSASDSDDGRDLLEQRSRRISDSKLVHCIKILVLLCIGCVFLYNTYCCLQDSEDTAGIEKRDDNGVNGNETKTCDLENVLLVSMRIGNPLNLYVRYDEELPTLYSEWSDNRRHYASRWDNVQYLEINKTLTDGPMEWTQQMFIRSLMKDESLKDTVDWIWWLDADAVIMDCSVSIMDLIHDHAITADSTSISNVSLVFNGDLNCLANTGSFAIRNDEWGLQFMEKWLFLKGSVTNQWVDAIEGFESKDQAIFNAVLAGFDPEEDHSQSTTMEYVHRALGDGTDIQKTLSRIPEEIRNHVAMMPHELWNSRNPTSENLFILHCAGDVKCRRRDIIHKYIRKQSNCKALQSINTNRDHEDLKLSVVNRLKAFPDFCKPLIGSSNLEVLTYHNPDAARIHHLPHQERREITGSGLDVPEYCSKEMYLYKPCLVSTASKRHDEASTMNGDIYWVKDSDFFIFVEEALPRIQHYFTLIYVHDLDVPHHIFSDEDDEKKIQRYFKRILENQFLLYIFREKYDETLTEFVDDDTQKPLVSPLPLGVPFHSGPGDERDQYLCFKQVVEHRLNAFNFESRTLQIYVDPALSNRYPQYLRDWESTFGANWGIWNIEQYPKVERNLFFVDESRMSKYEALERKSEFIFSLSLFKVGMDCHQTWEGILASNIVIVIQSPLDILYRRYDLPVISIKSLGEITENRLSEWYKEYKDKVYLNSASTREKMTNGFWMEMIQEMTKEKVDRYIQARDSAKEFEENPDSARADRIRSEEDKAETAKTNWDIVRDRLLRSSHNSNLCWL